MGTYPRLEAFQTLDGSGTNAPFLTLDGGAGSQGITQNTPIRPGTYNFHFGNGGSVLGNITEPMATGVLVGFAIRPDKLPILSFAAFLRVSIQGTTDHLTILVDSVGNLTAMDISGVVAASTAGPVIKAGSWQYAEILYEGQNNLVVVWIEGVEVLRWTTAPGVIPSTNPVNAFLFSSGGAGGNSYFSRFTDLYLRVGATGNPVLESERLGPIGIRYIVPTGDGVDQDWLPSSGVAGYAMIDNVPVISAQYVEGTVTGDISTYTKPTIPSYVTEVSGITLVSKAVQPSGVAQCTPAIVSGVSEAGSARVPTELLTPAYYSVPNDPSTTVPWTPAGLSAAQLKVTYD